MNDFKSFLSELAKVLDFQTLAPDKSGGCLLLMKEDNIQVLFEFDNHLVPNTILLSTLISTIPVDKRIEFYEASLEGNNDIEETLSIKPDEDVLYLHRRLHPDIQSDDLAQVLKIFLKHAKEWKVKADVLSKHVVEPSSKPASIQVFPKA